MVKLWITGAAGHVGSALCGILDCQQYEIFATDAAEVDITDAGAVHAYTTMCRPDIIINCAGMTDVAACEANPDRAYLVNALGVRNLAQEANTIGAELIQISSDDIFGGSREPRNEFDPAVPCSVYGKSKYAGEKLIEGLIDRHVIIRSSWVYGSGRDFVGQLLEKAHAGGVIEVPADQYGCPTSAEELADVILEFIEGEHYGVYHAVCRGSCSRYELAQAVLEITGLAKDVELRPVYGAEGGRPESTVLDNLMLRISGLQEPDDWHTALEKYLKKAGAYTE